MSDRTDYARRTFIRALPLAGVTALAGCAGTGDPSTNTDTDTDTDGSSSQDGGDTTGSEDSGGSGGQTDTATTTPAPMADKLTTWGWSTAFQQQKDQEKKYEEQTDAAVEVTQFGFNPLHDKLRSALVASSGAPAVSMAGIDKVASLADTGGLKNLNDWLERDGIRDKMVQSMWPPVTVEGKTYGLANALGPAVIFYRRDRFEEAGIDPGSIETWDQFVEAGKKIVGENNRMVGLPSSAQEYANNFRMFYRQQGGNPFPEPGKVDLDNDKTVRVFSLWKQFLDEGIGSREQYWTNGWYTSLNQGNIAAVPVGNWFIGFARSVAPDSAGKWGVIKMPAFERGGTRATNWGGNYFTIPNVNPKPEQRRGWDWAKFMATNVEVRIQSMKNYGDFPALKEAHDHPAMDEEIDFLAGQQARQIFAEVAQNTPGYTYNADTQVLMQQHGVVVPKLLDGKLTPEEAATRLAERVVENTDRTHV